MFNLNLDDQRLRGAARLAIQSAVAAAVTFLLMEWVGLPEKFVGVLTGVLVVQPSAGNTLSEALERIVATIVGCIIGIICLAVLPYGYGTAAALALAMLVMNGVAGFRNEWRYGVVAAVAMALGAEGDAVQTAFDRLLAIGIGSGVGALTAFTIWPSRGHERATRRLRKALDSIADLLDSAVHDALGDQENIDRDASSIFHANLTTARRAADGVRFRSVQKLQHDLHYIERLYNSALIINRVAEETDNVAGSDRSFSTDVEQLGERFCEVLRSLAKDERSISADDVKVLRESIESLQDTAQTHGSGARELLRQNALVFGFHEMLDQIEAILHGPDPTAQKKAAH